MSDTKPLHPHPQPRSQKTIHIYTYGYCCQNSKRGSRGAIGVYIRGTRIDDKHNIGATTSLYSKQTSEVSSLLAVQNVVEAYKRTTHPMYKYVHAPNVQLVLHVDTVVTKGWCTGRGVQLAKEGFPNRPHIELLKSVCNSCSSLQRESKVRITLTNENYTPDRDGTKMAKRLAKQAVERAITTTEKQDFYLNSHFGICMYDDGPRYDLDVPLHEHRYAISKGAWWDDEKKTFFVLEYDVGCHYDMRRTDWVNLRNMFEVDEMDGEV